MQGRARTEEEEGRDPRGAGFSRVRQGPKPRTTSPTPTVTPTEAVPVSRMLFMTPMKPANTYFLSSSKFLPRSSSCCSFSTPEAAILLRSARLTPGTRRAGRGVALSRHAGACVHQNHRGWESGWLYHSACGSAGTPQTLQGKARRPAQKIAVRRCSRWAASPAEPEPGGGACALGSRGRGR